MLGLPQGLRWSLYVSFIAPVYLKLALKLAR